ncbi:unnamed protein product [Protopolystoma xenopodis]|uniref:Uncharacterized protein n=1 Tax=Protopolystoma xenopodis TaxID=117903 RepID=A0A3S5CMA7_9PLAT|nr:unnamed protein product [Protopolystoma xenopodis]
MRVCVFVQNATGKQTTSSWTCWLFGSSFCPASQTDRLRPSNTSSKVVAVGSTDRQFVYANGHVAVCIVIF